MKRMVLFSCALSFALLLVANVYAEEASVAQNSTSSAIDTSNMKYERYPLNKLGRGLVNTLTCWIEVPAQVLKVSGDRDPFIGCTLGLAEGFCTALMRGVTGVFDVATFIVPPYNRPLMRPEYAITSFEDKYHEYDAATDHP